MALHIETPCIESHRFSARFGKSVWMKLEALQPSGSFKVRGVGHACEAYQARGARRFVSSSGGNAGLAVSYCGRRLGMPVLVVVPETTSERARQLIAQEGARVIVHGASWVEANAHALASLEEGDAFIHPFDDPLLWEGHATLVDEMARQGPRPDVVVVSVGGGGLLSGVAEGLRRNGWGDTPVVAVETRGSDSFARAVSAGRAVELPAITSIATSLGARAVSERALQLTREHRIESVVVTDAQAVQGCLDLLADHRVLVEPACGASLAVLHGGSRLVEQAHRIAVIVCGGVGVTVSQLAAWRTDLLPGDSAAW